MRYLLLIIVILFHNFYPHCQIQDDFSDMDLSDAPQWYGDINDFLVNNNRELQLNANSAGSSTIFFAYPFADPISWQIDIRMEFSPSLSNNLRVYLFATDSITGNFGGTVYIEIGQNGSPDPIRLIHSADSDETIIGSTDGLADADFVSTVIVNFVNDRWEIWLQDQSKKTLAGTFNNTLELPASDTAFFGLSCTYTSSRRDAYYFDNVLIAPYSPDTTGPVIINTGYYDSTTLYFALNEQPIHLPEASRISLSPPVAIDHVTPAGTDSCQFMTTLREPLTDGQVYKLSVSNLYDRYGNRTVETIDSFRYIKYSQPDHGDILITEIMFDPEPAIGLPGAEYVEIYNRTDLNFNLRDILLENNGKISTLPDMALRQGEYLILTEGNPMDFNNTAINFADLGPLRNTGGTLKLLTLHGDEIYRVVYSPNLYRDRAKDDGGWSVEMIDPEQPCELVGNWAASDAIAGGTPGKRNSIQALNTIDNQSPSVQLVSLNEEDKVVKLHFNELLFPATDKLKISIQGEVQNALNINGSTVEIFFGDEIPAPCTIRIEHSKNCLCEPMSSQEVNIDTIGASADGGIIINEVLADPYPGSSAFIELLNSRELPILVSEVRILLRGSSAIDIIHIDEPYILFPGTPFVITNNRYGIIDYYPRYNMSTIIEDDDIPGSIAGDAEILLITASGSVLDSFTFRENMHSALLIDTEGVSLERISPQGAGYDPDNWHSGSAISGYASPGLPNSNHTEPDSSSRFVALNSQIFSPDGDGVNDLLLLTVGEVPPRSYITATIHSPDGYRLRTLVDNEPLSPGDLIKWDGSTHDGRKTSPGIYILLVELFGENGSRDRLKQAVVVASQL